MVRHWKQRFDERRDADAPLIWIRPVTFAGRTIKPGDVLTDDERKLLGRARLRRYWDARYLAKPEVPVEIEFNQPDDVEPDFGEYDGE